MTNFTQETQDAATRYTELEQSKDGVDLLKAIATVFKAAVAEGDQ